MVLSTDLEKQLQNCNALVKFENEILERKIIMSDETDSGEVRAHKL